MRIATGAVKSKGFGICRVAVSGRGVCLVSLPGRASAAAFDCSIRERWPDAELEKGGAAASEAVRQLTGYLAGERTRFDLTLDLNGTAFQQRVWRACARIPLGQTRTYGQLARAAGRPRSSRAVGAAMARNPVPIVVPCHRVVGHDGRLTGFGGGLGLKRRLLAHEGAKPPPGTGRRSGELFPWIAP